MSNTKISALRIWLASAIFVLHFSACAQSSPGTQPNAPAPQTQPILLENPPVNLQSLPVNILQDQKHFWLVPFHLDQKQWAWTVPLAFIGAGMLASDTAIQKHVSTNSSTINHAKFASNAGLGALVGSAAGMFFWGQFTHSDQPRETGILSGEAFADTLIDAEVFKYATGRQRPFVGGGKGLFFHGGDSFPSQHAAAGWAIATVVTHEYPGPLTKILAYGLAGTVSATRVVGHQHFTTDVLVGSVLGWYSGRQIFLAHSHYSNHGISKWGIFGKADENFNRDPKDMGSPYVPLDSWIYPALEQLIAHGYIYSADLGMRPWTRMECARLLREASKNMSADPLDQDSATAILSALNTEFKAESKRLDGATNIGTYLDSVYTRFMGISGTPLTDGLHFGQTIVNDYGRPYGEGFNNITGFTSHGVLGPLFFQLQAEYQHAPQVPAISDQSAQVIQAVDGLPLSPAGHTRAATNRLDIVEGYFGLQIDNWQFTFGKQALWWGANQSGGMLFSTNAEPITMLQINRVKPFRLPSILGAIGDIRVDFILGRLDGHHWLFSSNSGFTGSWTDSLSDQPFIVGQKLSIKPSTNLELGISATALFGGNGVPATTHKLLQAMFSGGNGLPGTPGDAGDRRGGFDLNYRIPGLRDWLSFYADAFTDDEPNPWLAWNKAAVTSGLFLARVPKISKLSLRAEGIYTDPPGGQPTVQHGFFYINSRFKSGYTNDGNLIGSWIGRQGQGAQTWATYSLTPKSKVEFNFGHQKVSQQFIPAGGTLTDFSASFDYWTKSNVAISGFLQHEHWLFPVIQPNAEKNVTISLQITFEPHRSISRQ